MDTDWHRIKNTETGDIYPRSMPITIGSNSWMCMRSVVLKGGAAITEGSIVAAGSIESSAFDEPNLLIGGIPGKVIKHGVTMYDRYE